MEPPATHADAVAHLGPATTGQATQWAPLLAVGLGYAMVILDATAVNLALPALGRDLGASVTGMQWVIDAYTVTFAALLLTGGVASDRIGPRRAYLAGLAGFTVASAACGLAPSTGVLIAVRALQGAAAALTVPASLALLQGSFASASARAKAVGAWGAIAGVAAASGPILGGTLTALASWRLVFALNIPAGMAAIWLTRRRVRALPARPGARADWAGQVAAVIALAALTGALIEGGAAGWSSPLPATGFALAAAAGAAFLAAQLRTANPMLPLALLRRRGLAAGSAVGLLINLGFYGQLFVMSLYLQQARGYSPLAAGAALLPQAAVVPLASTVSGRLTSRGGPRRTMAAGLSLAAAGMAGLAMTGPGTPYLVLAGPLVMAGAGMALTMPAATTAVLESAPPGRAGLASGLINSARQVGSAVGVALVGALIAAPAGAASRPAAALSACAAAFLLGAAIAALPVERRPASPVRPR